MMKRILVWVPMLLALATTAPAAAQQMFPPISIEGRGGLSLPVGDFSRSLSLGYGLGADAIVNVTHSLGIYAGYRYISFDFDRDAVGAAEGSYNVQGIDAGARFGAPSLTSDISPYLRLGGVYYKGAVSGLGSGDEQRLGFQLGGGFDYALGPRVSLTPEISYTNISYPNRANVSFVTLDFGLRFHL
jgi:opacity protein-like surface antigen